MTFKSIFFVALCFTSLHIYSQDQKDKTSFSERMHYGGGINLGISNTYTIVGVSPSAIYEISDQWAAGVSVNYIYSKYKYDQTVYHILGGSLLAQYKPIQELSLFTELENLHVSASRQQEGAAYWVPAWYVGIGYSVGKLGSVGVRYDVLWDENKSIYQNALSPYFRIYF